MQTNGEGTPRVPIIIGGHGPRRTPALAARFADEFNVAFSDFEVSSTQANRVRAACERAGRDPGSLVYSAANVLCVGADEAEFARRAGAIGMDPAEVRKASPFAGTVAEVVDAIGTWNSAGITRAYLQTLDLTDLDHLSLVATEILPAVG
jgi:alkanesulfonate monooxygenase SsuD/methylene tetrahydromethanopterin reductase-like flavin-dependent oxidoreductase (luciferase family)